MNTDQNKQDDNPAAPGFAEYPPRTAAEGNLTRSEIQARMELHSRPHGPYGFDYTAGENCPENCLPVTISKPPCHFYPSGTEDRVYARVIATYYQDPDQDTATVLMMIEVGGTMQDHGKGDLVEANYDADRGYYHDAGTGRRKHRSWKEHNSFRMSEHVAFEIVNTDTGEVSIFSDIPERPVLNKYLETLDHPYLVEQIPTCLLHGVHICLEDGTDDTSGSFAALSMIVFDHKTFPAGLISQDSNGVENMATRRILRRFSQEGYLRGHDDKNQQKEDLFDGVDTGPDLVWEITVGNP